MLHSSWDLSSLTRDWTQAPAVRALSSNHWTTRKFWVYSFLYQCSCWLQFVFINESIYIGIYKCMFYGGRVLQRQGRLKSMKVTVQLWVAAWSWPWWGYLHHRYEQRLQIRAWIFALLANIFCKGLDDKYLRLYRPCDCVTTTQLGLVAQKLLQMINSELCSNKI